MSAVGGSVTGMPDVVCVHTLSLVRYHDLSLNEFETLEKILMRTRRWNTTPRNAARFTAAVRQYHSKLDSYENVNINSLSAYLIHSENYRYNSRPTKNHGLRRGFSTPLSAPVF